jgi:dTDP-glucose 4,6-dehydratase
MKVLVTGGSGFIGSALVRHLLGETEAHVVNVDKLTYAGNPDSLADVADSPRYQFEQVDICDAGALQRVFGEHKPDAVMHLAAESHVDRSIDGPDDFMQTNLMGTYTCCKQPCRHYRSIRSRSDAPVPLPACVYRRGVRRPRLARVNSFANQRLMPRALPTPPPRPARTTSSAPGGALTDCRCSLPTVRTTTAPYQFPEKLIPHMILNALAGKPLPVYGDGSQVRDWLYVEDHARALWTVLTERKGWARPTTSAGTTRQRNIDVVRRFVECWHAGRLRTRLRLGASSP